MDVGDTRTEPTRLRIFDHGGWALPWRVALAEGRTQVEDVATIPFASRSLAFDGERFWSNHRAANEIMSFTLAGEGL